MPEFDSKHISAGLAAIGMVALAAAGVVNFTTPREEELQEKLKQAEIGLAVCKTNLDHSKENAENMKASKDEEIEALEKAKDACKTALAATVKPPPKPPKP